MIYLTNFQSITTSYEVLKEITVPQNPMIIIMLRMQGGQPEIRPWQIEISKQKQYTINPNQCWSSIQPENSHYLTNGCTKELQYVASIVSPWAMVRV